jgi:diguanylate cyclase (GGDEF)-like protein
MAIWLPAASPALEAVAAALRAEGGAGPQGSDGGGHWLALLDATTAPRRELLDLLAALQARHLRAPALVAVLALDAEAGAAWVAEGADDFATTPAELHARVRARLVRPERSGDRPIPLQAAAELAIGEVERTLDATGAELLVSEPRGLRRFAHEGGRVLELDTARALARPLALTQPGVRVLRPDAPELGGDLPPNAAAVALLELWHEGRPLGALRVPLEAEPTPKALEALAARGPLLADAVRGALTLDEAYLGRFRDLLESNRRLRELSHAKDEFLAVCAHDLRSPLTALRSHATLLAQGGGGALTPRGESSVQAMLRQVQTMAELIHSLLGDRALETGSLELVRTALDPAALLGECLEEAQPAAQNKGVALVALGLGAARAKVEVDGPRLREAVGNLLANAIKYTPAGGRVELSLAQDAGGTTIAIGDNGPGIAPDELPLLFQRYRRGRSGRAQGDGVGLGLSWAREVVRLHGGSISVQSALGVGTRFSVRLPAAEAAPPPPERARVLVVEDDRDVREVMRDLLADRFDVLLADDGEDGVRKARSERPDVVLMDLFMPRLDGFAALEDLRRDARTVETPVIFLSGSGDEQVKLRVLGLGAADYLVKPFSPRELVARVEKALESTRQRRAFQALAQTDALTGLPNYGAFRTRLDEELKRASRYGTPLAAVMIDLDHLKQLNDGFGHELGNRAIVTLADHVRGNLRGSDFAARFGGDEFVVLLPHTQAEEAAIFAERVRAGLATLRLATPSGAVGLAASFGVAALPTDGCTAPEEALRGADAALYAAKRAGRDRVCVGGPSRVAPVEVVHAM